MKKQFFIVLSVITGLLAACSTANFAYYDDIYTSTGEKAVQNAVPRAAQTSAATAPDGTTMQADSIIYETDENGNLLRTLTYYPGSSEPVITYYTEVADSAAAAAASNGYNPDDYYDYCYSSRLRRFHTGVSLGFGYYDPFFTNVYWYDNCPASWGISIYMGYNWWWPNYCYRPYYYGPYWYDCGFRYGWGWYRPYPYYAWDPYYPGPHGPHGPHGPAPIDYYHNHHDPNHAYYHGHRNNIGPSVGNGDRGKLPEGRDNGGIGGGGVGYGNGETNNHYSVTSSPVAFNQRYDNIVAGTTGTGSANHNGGSTNQSTQINDANTNKLNHSYDPSNTLKPVNGNSQPTSNRVPEKPVNSSNMDRPTSAARTDATPATATTTITRPAATGATTTSRPAASATSQPTRTVTRTVVTPSSVNTRPVTTSGNRPAATTRPSSSTYYPSGTYNSRPSSSSTTRPSSSAPSNNRGSSYSRPSSSSTPSSRSNYNTPSSNSRPSSSSSSSSRPSYNSRSSSSSSSSSRSSYSSPSSSSRSSYSSGSSRSSSGSYSGGGRSGGGFSGGGRSGGGHSGGRR